MDASISSGGWVRASGLPLFKRMLLPSELHRKRQSQRWDSNPLTPLYKSGTRPVEHRRLIAAVRAGLDQSRSSISWVTSSKTLSASSR